MRPAGRSWWIVAGWLLIAYSLLIKPQAAVVLPLMLAFAFVDRERRRVRLIVDGRSALSAASLLALVIVEPFHASNPVAAFSWLIGRYSYGSSVYAYNSVNAFNLWAIRGFVLAARYDPDKCSLVRFRSGRSTCGASPSCRRPLGWSVALPAGSYAARAARGLRGRNDRVLRAGDAHARTLPL